MKISTKGRYGLRAMLDLALNSAGDLVTLSSIADRQGVSANYLEQVFAMLRKSGLVKSVKGAQGGYVLAERPSQITVGSILRALEGELSVTDDHVSIQDLSPSVEYCLQKNVWEKINESINLVVDSITLGDLMDEQKRLTDNQSMMYYI